MNSESFLGLHCVPWAQLRYVSLCVERKVSGVSFYFKGPKILLRCIKMYKDVYHVDTCDIIKVFYLC